MQSAHACIKLSQIYQQGENTPYLVLCSVENENKLKEALYYLEKNNINCVSFREPDIENQLTAIAVAPISGLQRKIFKHFKLYKEKRK